MNFKTVLIYGAGIWALTRQKIRESIKLKSNFLRSEAGKTRTEMLRNLTTWEQSKNLETERQECFSGV
jgi:hypothetical protein